MHQDIGSILESGEDLSVPLPVTALTGQTFQADISQGLGDEIFRSVITVLEEWAG